MCSISGSALASDLGLTGPDRGAGGRYVAVGPGQTPPSIPNARTIATATLNIFVATRILATDSTEAARLKDGFSLYPAARADHPSRRRIVHPDGRAWSGAHPRGLAYWELVARLVNQEPVHERDRILVAMLEHVGIVKGRSFAPDGRQRRILEEAALVGEAMARAMSHERRFEGATMYPGTAWTNALLFEPDQEGEHTTKLDERTAWFYEAVTATKGMTTKTPGEGQAYLHVSRDRSGAWLVGDHAYELTIPANVPVEQFWSFTVYDTDTRCFIDTPHERADRSSRDPLDVNDDGSVTLHIGPVPPASGDANWIPTVPGRGWFGYFRFYAPKAAYFDRSWQLPDIRRIGGRPSGIAVRDDRSGPDTIEHYIHEYANQEQVRMMTAWLEKHQPGTFSFTGLVDPDDATVITPQATVDYGYCWFSLSDGPAIVRTPGYRYFFSVSVFDMDHNVPAVVVHPTKPILLTRPGQPIPEGDFEIVELETDQGLVFTRMVVVDNLAEVEALRAGITMEGGEGDMHRPVARFSAAVEKAAQAIIAGAIPHVDPDIAFGRRSKDTGDITRAAAVMLGQLGTPSETVRYAPLLTDDDGAPLDGTHTYEVTVPAGIVRDDGYFSVTVYGTDNKLLIPNEQRIYDRTTYTTELEADGTAVITLSPDGTGHNGIPTGKPFYGLLRAYQPVRGAQLRPTVRKR